MIVKCNSHRASYNLRKAYPTAAPYYHLPTLFTAKGKNYYYLLLETDFNKVTLYGRKIKGVTMPKDQNVENYGRCWS